MNNTNCVDMSKLSKEVRKEYCVHNFQAAEERVKSYREMLIEAVKKVPQLDWWIKELRESLKDEKRHKKSIQDDHCIYCLGNMFHLVLK